MTADNREQLLALLQRHKDLGISEQIDHEKYYLYSIITHSTAIEGSTVTEVEAQLLFDEGITSNKRTIIEQNMNLDLKSAYEYGREWIKKHADITSDWLIILASKVMERTGSEYHSPGGDFSAAKGELRKLNVTAGVGGKSYMSYLKVPTRLAEFCKKLNEKRRLTNPTDLASVYELSFWAHFELVTIHPWADGNGRMSRLLMNLIQMEFDVLPTKVLKEDKAEYIQALIDTREKEDIEIFLNSMTEMHCRHIQQDIDNYILSFGDEMTDETEKVVDKKEKMVDKSALTEKMVDKWQIKPSLAEKLADILLFMDGKEQVTTEVVTRQFGFNATTSRRYLRQLTEFGILEAQGANKNRSYRMCKKEHAKVVFF